MLSVKCASQFVGTLVTIGSIQATFSGGKMSKKEISFTEGPVFQSLLRFAIPVLGALILQAAYGAVDLLIVGKFGNASSPNLMVSFYIPWIIMKEKQ